MKKTILVVALLLTAITTNAQFYVSASGGYSIAVGEKTLGQKVTATTSSDLNGSYGEGAQTQLRGGYFFNDKFGVELGVGYLYGTNQDVQDVSIPGASINIEARGRAFGASLSGIYNITENFYARAGLLTKIGGKTEAVASLDLLVPATVVNPAAPAGQFVDLNADFTTDFHGKFPLGFIGAIGYKFPITDNWSLFAEAEYLSINVTRDTSDLGDYSATLAGGNLPSENLYQILNANPLLEDLAPLLLEGAKWGEGDLPSSKAPYSSLGINFGFTYTFGK
ncbi:outer membrane protein with beta-barrel domain [Tenacibaculum adriaticum]|uniref:Outer membrane protein with beta-barrel domain n=1 Tax=Tenacibaculum adriaticum TaxID=413713 RepID=A0A5S5DT07_9FLAO|nr:outer membrane beta-barrel protein [Tenacibaculum adriaticum]TYP99063.1 outer membrane protein with beta-barrel domain [Tenacibaculum adriaticum]